MNRRNILNLSAIAMLGLALMSGSADAKQKTLKQQIVGSWIFVGSTGKRPDGSPNWGPNPKGILILGANGQYANMLLRSDIPKYAANNRLNGTADENKATVQGGIASYGTYTVNESDRSYTIQIEASSYPNWSGSKQTRTVASVTADELKINNPAPSIGGAATVLTYKRAK